MTRREDITNSEIAGVFDWCIAGGFAACPDLAGDTDVWVLVGNRSAAYIRALRENILSQLRQRGVQFVEEEEETQQPREGCGDDAYLVSGKVARLADNRQIILSTASDVQSLLETFDVSTHQIALTSDGALIRGSGFTSIYTRPVALRDTPTTDERLVKIRARYRLEDL